MTDRLRAPALIALIVGAAGSLAFMLRAGRGTPLFLLVIFTFWVLSPFAILAWTHLASARWPPLTRTVAHVVTLVVRAEIQSIYDRVPADRKPYRA